MIDHDERLFDEGLEHKLECMQLDNYGRKCEICEITSLLNDIDICHACEREGYGLCECGSYALLEDGRCVECDYEDR